LNRKKIFLSSRIKLLTLGFLALIIAIMLFFIYNKKDKARNTDKVSADINKINSENLSFDPQTKLDRSLDSILYTFGIKKEWITNETQKKPNQKAEWFIKSVLIPKDLTSVEVNLEISSFVKEMGMSTKVNENILNKDIVITIENPDTLKTLPAAIVQINHSDKAVRETCVIAIIIDKINSFKKEDIDKLILTKSEFSYLFPRNLDDIDIQQKLLHSKKDIIIGLTYAGKDNYEADFNSGMDEKNIHEKIKSFNSDYTSINKVLLINLVHDPSLNNFGSKIASELVKYNITVITDSMFINGYNNNDKDKLSSFFNVLAQKTNISRNIIALYPADRKEFDDFYNRILIYKKLGYKFYNLADYFSYLESSKRREQLKAEKQNDLKKKNSNDLKVPPKKGKDKKTKTEMPEKQPGKKKN